MAEISAKLNYLRVSPRKARLVVDFVRGKTVEEAKKQLMFSKKGVSPNILKLLNSAVANATNNFNKTEDNLYIKKICVDQGPTYKRYRPRARGMVSPISKRTSHVTLILSEREKSKKQHVA